MPFGQPTASAGPIAIRIGYEMTLDMVQRTPMLLYLYTHPSRHGDLDLPDAVISDPPVEVDTFIDAFGNRVGRTVVPAGRVRLWTDSVIRDDFLPDVLAPGAGQHPVETLPPGMLTFLLPSRFAESDRLAEVAWELFADTRPGWERVQAVCDWVHESVEFGYGHARAQKSAWEVYCERKGVCRDFMHLAIAFCRALNIPARYATGYLGDIDIPPLPFPMDFSTWFEVYLEGGWYTFDARFNVPRRGRILMARGRDAADVALTTTFGRHTLIDFRVWTDLADASWQAAARAANPQAGASRGARSGD